ncbi:CMRF35-like molecule 5 isoform X2 [Hemibagrus wyckioides]|uniref:CMRF35-like molecule 5 isoform X2 n=1 Tax=Hemibagrus wyckioides TaxID=337641 RepID=UPI00266D9853|nr:CMRF35-like molecule 5 isoform X2 [Hemibagrus wyckioides]
MIMKLLLCAICVLLSAQCFVTSELKINGYTGQSVTIECSHVWAVGNRKYFCKDPCKEEKDVVVDSVKPTPSKYELQDRGNIFTVIITDLKMTDSGKYWCAVDRSVTDTYTKVILTVVDAPTSSSPLNTRAHIYSPSTISYLGAISITFNATFTAVTIATVQSTDYNNIKTETLVKWQCCPGRREASDSEGNSFGNQNSISHNPHPASINTPSDYENFLNVSAISSTHNIYTVHCNE